MSLVITSDLADREAPAPVVPSHADLIVLNRRPGAALLPGDLVRDRRALPKPAPGQVVVHNILTTVDEGILPNLRGYGRAPVAVGDPIPATSVGRVVGSADPAVPVGTRVRTSTGWQTLATTTITSDQIVDLALGGPLDWVTVLDSPGVIAYLGVHDIGRVRAGASVLVTEAASATGGAAVQLARAAGARVVAMAGGRYRVNRAAELLGADAVIDYLDPAFPGNLRAAVGDGVDLVFDSSGDHHLQLSLSVIKDNGSIVLCDAELTPGVLKHVTLSGHLVGRRTGGRLYPVCVELAATMRAHVVADKCLPAVRAELGHLVRMRRLGAVVTEFEGLDRAPAALATAAEHGLSVAGRCVVWMSAAERPEWIIGGQRGRWSHALPAAGHR